MTPKTNPSGQPTLVARTKATQPFSWMTMETLSYLIPISTNFGKVAQPEENNEIDDL